MKINFSCFGLTVQILVSQTFLCDFGIKSFDLVQSFLI